MSECKSCDAPIVWAVHATTGSFAPIDKEPTEGGNVALKTDEMGVTRYRVLTKPAEETFTEVETFHTSHFATCPDSAAHRRHKT